jgi:plastocyanin
MIGVAFTGLSATPSRAEMIRITADKLTFSPAQISARVGDTIEWANADFVAQHRDGPEFGLGCHNPAWQDVSSGNQEGRVGRLLLPLSPEHDSERRRQVN